MGVLPVPVKRAKTQHLTDTFQLPLRGSRGKNIKHHLDKKNTKERRPPKDTNRKKLTPDSEHRREYDRAKKPDSRAEGIQPATPTAGTGKSPPNRQVPSLPETFSPQ